MKRKTRPNYKHIRHVEDLVLYGGVDGTRQAINTLRSLRDMLHGHHEGRVTVKWDGAPAIFAGTDPEDGRFFVATKSIFNNTPRVYKTTDDIFTYTQGDLADKLSLALRYLPELNIDGIVAGDFLFSDTDIETQTIKGQRYVTFHPNTIVYAVPADTDLAKKIHRAKIGIVWHTTYKGTSLRDLKPTYGVDVQRFNKSNNVLVVDANLHDVSHSTMSRKDTDEVNQHLSRAGVIFNGIASTTLKQLEADSELADLIQMYQNSYIRRGLDIDRDVDKLIEWIEQRFELEINERKTVAGKTTMSAKLHHFLEFFSPTNRESLKRIFELQMHLTSVKKILINTLNRMQNIDTFVRTHNGFRVSTPEGYVAIDKLGGDAVKIVDRLEFSHNNFSDVILQGWDKPGRRR